VRNNRFSGYLIEPTGRNVTRQNNGGDVTASPDATSGWIETATSTTTVMGRI